MTTPSPRKRVGVGTGLAGLRNLGPRSVVLLAGAGIHGLADLRARGAVETFLAVRRSGQAVSLNLLWAVEGALTGRDWRDVAKTEKLRLLLELEARKESS